MACHRIAYPGCGGCGLSRRNFLGACAALGAGALAIGPYGRWPRALGTIRAAETDDGAPGAASAKAKVRLVFTHVPSTGPVWPHIGYDFDSRKKELAEKLSRACPEVEFLPTTVMSADQAKEALERDDEVDGYLIWTVGIWTGAPTTISAKRKPTLIVDDLYGGSGEFLIAYATALRAGHKVAGVSSSRFGDVVEAARCFAMLKRGKSADDFVAACTEKRRRSTPSTADVQCKADALQALDIGECLERVRGKKLLAVGGGWGMPASGKAVQEAFGLEVVPVEFAELHGAFERADREEAGRWAEKWLAAAEKTLEPTKEDVVSSAAMHVAMQEILRKHRAEGITINCLGGFYGGHLKAYPCLGFTELNDSGKVGGCEGDVTSAVTMLVAGTLTGRPGFISDPVIDTSRRQIIYAHCVAPTKVFGPEGSANPYHIRSHSEDRKGAVVRSLMPAGYLTTTIEIDSGRKEIILHQGRSVENVDDDKACRSKLAVEVKGDMEKLFASWDQWGWHRVTFYGDLKAPIQELAKAAGMRVVEEA